MYVCSSAPILCFCAVHAFFFLLDSHARTFSTLSLKMRYSCHSLFCVPALCAHSFFSLSMLWHFPMPPFPCLYTVVALASQLIVPLLMDGPATCLDHLFTHQVLPPTGFYSPGGGVTWFEGGGYRSLAIMNGRMRQSTVKSRVFLTLVHNPLMLFAARCSSIRNNPCYQLEE